MRHTRTTMILGVVLAVSTATSVAALQWNVPGDNSGTCTIAVPSCDTIAAAVAAASANDSIEVAAGTYPEAGIIIDKTLLINGAGAALTVLDVSGSVGLHVRADDVTLSNLTVQNATQDGIRLDGSSVAGFVADSVTIASNASDGIQIGDAPGTYTNIQIVDSTFTSNAGSGMRMTSTSIVDGLSVTGTTFSGGGLGIYQANDGGTSRLRDLTVDDCIFQNTTGTAAIFANELRDSVIENSVFDTNQRGLLLFKFFTTSGVEVSNVTIQGNQFIDSSSISVQIQIHTGPLENPITIHDNQFTQNVGLRTSNSGLIHVNLASAHTHAQVNITDNRATLSGTFGSAVAAYGVVLRGNGPVVVTGNVFDGGNVGGPGNSSNPPSAGIAIRSTDTTGDFAAIPSGATFSASCNRIFGFEHGVTIYDPVNLAPGGLNAGVVVSVNDNAIVDNNLAGVANGATPTVDAEDNYWGCAAGPGNAGCDDIIGGVDADPVAVAPPACVACLVDADCSDDNLCNGVETCDTPSAMCQSGAAPNCNDSNPCTQDSCDPSLGCVNAGTPMPACATSAKAKLLLVRNVANETKDKVFFNWIKGTTLFAEFGDPAATTAYSLCVYDDAGAVLGMTAPPGGDCGGKPCWKQLGRESNPNGWLYKDRRKPAPNDGMTLIKTKASDVGKAKLLVKGARETVPPFDLTGGLTLPVTAQVVTSDGPICWEAVFTTSRKNDGAKFIATWKAP